jgi:TRAP-type C4-dicarboxylate transport system permease large subunit
MRRALFIAGFVLGLLLLAGLGAAISFVRTIRYISDKPAVPFERSITA